MGGGEGAVEDDEGGASCLLRFREGEEGEGVGGVGIVEAGEEEDEEDEEEEEEDDGVLCGAFGDVLERELSAASLDPLL